VAGDQPVGATSDQPDDVEALRALVGQLRTHFETRGRSGLQGVPMMTTKRQPTSPAVAAPSATAPSVAVGRAVEEPVREISGEPGDAADIAPPKPKIGKAGLQVVRDELGECQRCKLSPSRTKLVFGVGNPDADLVFVGEAPGADEDAQGEPFVGKAGQLLTKMIEAMGYTRDDVYICNVLKCRPPGNRNPEPDEVAKCEPFLKQQLAAIRPRMIVALGKFAAQCLLRDDTPITRLRGGFRSYEGIPLMPTLHPAYLLRDPSKKKLAWEDLKAVNAALARVGIHPPRPPAA
jgi:DNA polymerase